MIFPLMKNKNNFINFGGMEIYKDIEGYENLYQVSNLGNVKSLKRNQLLRPSNNDGYLCVVLSKYNKQKTYKIHRLVAQAFIPNPDNLPQVNHKDENPSNNSVDNLEYCDCKYNNNYGTAIQRRSKKTSKPIICIEINKVFQSAIEAEEWIGRKGTQAGICMCLKGKQKTAYGYHWKYVDGNNWDEIIMTNG